MKRKLITLCFAVILLMTGCTKEENTEDKLAKNQYYLVAADKQKILITLPDNFETEEQDTEVSVLKSYYRANVTELLSLHFFEETDEYSVRDIEDSFADYMKQYEELVSSNNGEIIDKTEVSDLSADGMDGKYVEVTYKLGEEESYCGEFYLKEDSHVLHGTMRLAGEDKDAYAIDELAKMLVEDEL